MRTPEFIKKEIKSLIEKEKSLINFAKEDSNIAEFGVLYQEWYSRAYKLVEFLAPERLAEFTSYYMIDPKRKTMNVTNYVIQDYIKGIAPRFDPYSEYNWDNHAVVVTRVINQVQILASLASRIDSVLQDVTGHLYSELQDSELRAAAQLKKVSLRAAGALAGVVLERHLQRVSKNHNVSIRKKSPTISDLNDPLKKSGVYDVPFWRKIQLLSDIRNICSHQKASEPTNEQIDELIDGVNTIIKSVF